MCWRIVRKIGVISISILAMVIVVLCKKDFYIDELLSYSLANNEKGWMHFTDDEVYSPAESIFVDQLSAKDGSLFAYKNVWNNQAEDVHPPLYYALLHTICSLSPNRISVWQPAIINFLFVLLTMYVLKKILNLFSHTFEISRDRYDVLSNLVIVVWSILPGILNNVSFFRMYVMAMFMVSWNGYLGIEIVKNIYENKTVKWGKWIEVLIASICAALTHYYCILFLVLLQITLFVEVLCKRKFKIILWQFVVEVFAAIVAIAIFPSMLNHIFSGYRGVEVQNNLVNVSMEAYFKQLKMLFMQINKGILGGGAIIILVISIIVFLYKVLIKRENISKNLFKMKMAMIRVLFIPCLVYLMILGKITIMMDQRYLAPIYAIIYVGTIIVVFYILKVIKLDITIGVMVFLVLLVLGAYRKPTWDYLYLENTLIDTMKNYKDIDAVVIYNDYWKCVETYRDLENSKSVTFLKANNLELQNSAISNRSEMIVYSENEDNVLNIFENMNGTTECQKIGESRYFMAYYLR